LTDRTRIRVMVTAGVFMRAITANALNSNRRRFESFGTTMENALAIGRRRFGLLNRPATTRMIAGDDVVPRRQMPKRHQDAEQRSRKMSDQCRHKSPRGEMVVQEGLRSDQRLLICYATNPGRFKQSQRFAEFSGLPTTPRMIPSPAVRISLRSTVFV